MSEKVIHEAEIVARKSHKCTSCNCTIQKGDLYSRTRLVEDGKFKTDKGCYECMGWFEEHPGAMV